MQSRPHCNKALNSTLKGQLSSSTMLQYSHGYNVREISQSMHVAGVASRQSSTVYNMGRTGVEYHGIAIHVRTLKKRKIEKITIKTYTYARTYGRCVNNR